MYNSWLEISKSAILHNLSQFKKVVGKSVAIMPIVKSNAYGHGMMEVAKIISPKVKWLGVASLGEALALRKNKIKNRILVLSYAQSRYLKEGISKGIDLPVYDLNYAKVISAAAKAAGKKAKVHVKIDTGTSRLGILTNEAIEFVKKVKQIPNLEIVGIFSHFAASEENPTYTRFQLKNFNEVLAGLKKEGIEIPYKHFACSAAILARPDVAYNLVRLGIGLYGLWPSEQIKKMAKKMYPELKLKPALSWKTKIIQIKELPKGTKVGYGGTYTAKKKIKMAVLPVGYWEGYDRHLSNKSFVQVGNKKCPVIGRVCMNLTMVDISGINAEVGDEVILLGKDVSAEDLAEIIGTINYEVVTRINPLLERIIVK